MLSSIRNTAFILILSSLISHGSHLAQVPTAAVSDDLASAVSVHEIPGISAAILVDNSLLWSGSSGYADVEGEKPI